MQHFGHWPQMSVNYPWILTNMFSDKCHMQHIPILHAGVSSAQVMRWNEKLPESLMLKRRKPVSLFAIVCLSEKHFWLSCQNINLLLQMCPSNKLCTRWLWLPFHFCTKLWATLERQLGWTQIQRSCERQSLYRVALYWDRRSFIVNWEKARRLGSQTSAISFIFGLIIFIAWANGSDLISLKKAKIAIYLQKNYIRCNHILGAF